MSRAEVAAWILAVTPRDPASGCRHWALGSRSGLPSTTLGGREVLAHRIVLEDHSGGPAARSCYAHRTCGERSCVEPLHMTWRSIGGRLTPEAVAEIRARLDAGESGAALGREYGVTRGMVSHIRTGRAWPEPGPEPEGRRA